VTGKYWQRRNRALVLHGQESVKLLRNSHTGAWWIGACHRFPGMARLALHGCPTEKKAPWKRTPSLLHPVVKKPAPSWYHRIDDDPSSVFCT
jgi:hypothetical protein